MTTLRKVTCKTCGKVANWADEYGPAFSPALCACAKEKAMSDLSNIDQQASGLSERERYIIDCVVRSCCQDAVEETIHHLTEGLEQQSRDGLLPLRAPPALQWTSTPPSEPCRIVLVKGKYGDIAALGGLQVERFKKLVADGYKFCPLPDIAEGGE